ETASGCKVENAECSGDGEAPAPGNVGAVTVIDKQKVRPNLDREQDRGAFALVQAQQFGIAVTVLPGTISSHEGGAAIHRRTVSGASLCCNSFCTVCGTNIVSKRL